MQDYKNPLHLGVVDRYLRRMGDYKNPLHLDVVDRYLRRMGDKTIPDEAPPSLESFCPVHSGVWDKRRCLKSIYPSLGMRQLFGDVTMGQWRHS